VGGVVSGGEVRLVTPGTDPAPDDFAAWVEARSPALLRLAYVLTGNRAEAEDLVQEALSRALPRWSRIAEVEHPDAYVRRMVVNAHTSWWRRFRRRETLVAEPFPQPLTEPRGGGPHDPAYLIELARVWAGCRALPEPQRTAVVLRYYEDLPYDEIAALTGVREGTARSRVSRGLMALRELLTDEEEEP
jgi:RNA polymerase sigma-70 factor (sigma-E family)